MSQEEILRSSTFGGGKSNAKGVSKREIQSILAWKNTVAQLNSEDSFQPLPPLSYQVRHVVCETVATCFACVGKIDPPLFQQSDAQRIRTQQIRRFIIQEIYTTEQTYLDHLNIIKTMFMDPFIAAATQTSRPLVNPNDISTIFAYIPNIIEVSDVLAYRFEAVAKSWHEQSSLIGAVFNQMENDFEVYIRYAVNFHHSQRCITRAHNNILYRRFIQESLRKKETNRMGLNDYMIIPIQRVTRYSLLLKDLKKHTPPNHPDYINIDKALKTMTGLALAMNDAQRKP
ncbi:Dbl homology domain-containing protein [Umbelopsis sp. AD052]|nr:Dbl homology domain-containing protein [Umbelopsis sp. AD052]